jgi:hypothetical protein
LGRKPTTTQLCGLGISRGSHEQVIDDDHDRAYFGRGLRKRTRLCFIDASTLAIFGRSYAAEPDVLIEQLRKSQM